VHYPGVQSDPGMGMGMGAGEGRGGMLTPGACFAACRCSRTSITSAHCTCFWKAAPSSSPRCVRFMSMKRLGFYSGAHVRGKGRISASVLHIERAPVL
jgi:hypothetical protein